MATPRLTRAGFVAGIGAIAYFPVRAAGEPVWLRLSAFGHSSAIDPYTTQAPNVSDMAWLYADGLIGASQHGPVALLAEEVPSTRNGLVTRDGRAVRYRLRQGPLWHDGKELAAQDVVEVFQRARRAGWGSNRPYSLVRHIEATSRHELRVELSEPDPMFPMSFFSAYGDPNLPLIRPGRLPIGTGPFAIRSHSLSTGAYDLKAWPHSPRGMPRIPEMSYRFMPDQNTEAVAFAAGELDIALYVPGQFVEARHLRYARYTGGAVTLIANVTGALSKISLRSLVWRSIDREEIRRKVFGDWGLPAPSIVSPELDRGFAYPTWSPDPAKLRRELSSAAPSGLRLTYTGLPGIAERIGLLLAAQLAAVGITLAIKLYSPQEYFALDGPLRSGRFDLALDIAPYSLDPDLENKYSCAAAKPPGMNFSRICDPALNRAIDAEDYAAVTRDLWRDAAVMPLAQIVNAIGLGPRVKRFRVQNYVPITYYCNEWSLK